MAVRDYLIEQRDYFNKVDGSLADRVANGDDPKTLESLGLDTMMRAAIIRGIDLFTDFQELYESMVAEEKIIVSEDRGDA